MRILRVLLLLVCESSAGGVDICIVARYVVSEEVPVSLKLHVRCEIRML